jgi:hypothetical protein
MAKIEKNQQFFQVHPDQVIVGRNWLFRRLERPVAWTFAKDLAFA